MIPIVNRWPELRIGEWADTQATLHRWTQIVGKIRLQQVPLVNHWWNVTLYVTSRGLTTGLMPHRDGRTFEIAFDFLDRALIVAGCDGERAEFVLEPMSVAEFYRRLMQELASLGFPVRIVKKPNELADATPLDVDTTHHSYDREHAERFWRALLEADRLCKRFRAMFLGKASPVHFFWGSFDLAVTFFSGRSAPEHPGGIPNMPDAATREAYSREEISVGFWPGAGNAEAAFYAYAYPQPDGYAQRAIRPAAASWNGTLREFMLPYEAVRTSAEPDAAVLEFFETAYANAAELAHWDRAALERAAASQR